MRLFKGSANIHIGLDKGSGVQAYHPGETLEALIQVRPDMTINCRDVEIRVGWHTEGTGDRNSDTYFVDMAGVTSLTPNNPLTHEIRCTLPYSPWSYEGELIRIVWAVYVKIDISMMPDMNHQQPFILIP